MNNRDGAAKDYCDFHYAWQRFHLSRSTLYRLAALRLIRAIKSGRRTLWSVESILAYLNAQPEAALGKSAAPLVAGDQAHADAVQQ
jgi:hypothetical protein